MTESSLYERLGGAFAIAAGLTTSAKQSCTIRSSASNRRTPASGNGTPTIWADFPASSSCARCGSATLPVDPSTMQRRNRAVLRSAWKKRIGNGSRRSHSSEQRARYGAGSEGGLNSARSSSAALAPSAKENRLLSSERSSAASPRSERPYSSRSAASSSRPPDQSRCSHARRLTGLVYALTRIGPRIG
jgi:hypothetical protein